MAALATALLSDSPRWFGLTRRLFYSGPYLLQAYAAQILVMCALACFAAALWGRRSPLRWHPVLALVLGLLAWTCLTTALSPSPASAVLGYSMNSQGLLSRIVATAALMLAASLVDGTSRIRISVRAIGLVGGISAAIGLLQVLGFDVLGSLSGWGWGRSYGTLGNPDMFGGFIMIPIFASVGAAMSEKAPVWRAAMWVSAALCAAAAVTSYSRAAWLGIAVGSVVLALLTARSHLRVDRRLVLAGAIFVLAVGLLIALRPATPGGAIDVPSRLATAVSPTDPDSAMRLEIWASATRAVVRRPIRGYGPDTMVIATSPVLSRHFASIADPGTVMESAHSLPLQVLSDLGVPGFLLWATLLVAVAVMSFRTTTSGPERSTNMRFVLAGLWTGCAAYLADSLFTPSSPAGTLCFFYVLGLLLAPSLTGHMLAARRPRRAIAGIGVTVAAAGVVLAFVFLVADMRAGVARDQTLAGSFRDSAAASAVALNPLSVDYAVVYGSTLVGDAERLSEQKADPALVRQRFEAALSQASRTVALEPTNQRRRTFLADVLLVGSRHVDPALRAQALSEFMLAAEMSPNDLQTRYVYAQALEPVRARPVLEAILRLRPGSGTVATALARLHLLEGNIAAARQVMGAALAASPSVKDRKVLEGELAATRTR